MGLASEQADQVLVTGGGGFIGRFVVKKLLEMGSQVVTTFRSRPSDKLPSKVRQVPFEYDNLVREFRHAGTVIHLAARTGGIEYQRAMPIELFFSNRGLTDRVLVALAESQTPRLILASSAAVYAPSSRPLAEDSKTIDASQAESAYAVAKLLDELNAGFVRGAHGTTIVVARIGNVYGEGGHFDSERSSVIHGLIARSIHIQRTGRLIAWGSADTVRSFVHVQDVAEGIALLTAAKSPGHVYNVDSGVAVNIGHVAALIAEAAAPGSQVEFDGTRPRGDPFRVLSIQRLEGLGFKPHVHLEEGIHRTLDYFLAHGERQHVAPG